MKSPKKIPFDVTTIDKCFKQLLSAKSANTQRAYRGDVASFFDWAGGENWAGAVFDLVRCGRIKARERIGEYQAERLKTDAHASVRRRVATLQSILTRLKRDGYIDWNLEIDSDTCALNETYRSTSQRDMSGPTPDEMKNLRVSLDADDSIAGLRDRALIALLENPMLHVHEVVALTRGDIDLVARRVSIPGKRHQETDALPIPTPTCADVQAWLDVAEFKPSMPLFRQIVRFKRKKMERSWRQIGEQWLTEDSLSATAIHEMTGARGRAAGLKGRLRPHGLRHTGIALLVTDCVRSGIHLSEAMKITRHKKLETLVNYVGQRGAIAADILERTAKVTR